MINFNPAITTYNQPRKHKNNIKVKGYNGQKSATMHIIERRKLVDRRQSRQPLQKFDRRQVMDRRRTKIDLSI